jgi:hypothetical protein
MKTLRLTTIESSEAPDACGDELVPCSTEPGGRQTILPLDGCLPADASQLQREEWLAARKRVGMAVNTQLLAGPF